jgi:hypothetical protein
MNEQYSTERDVSIFLLENRDRYSIIELTRILGFKSRTSIINRIKKLNIPRKSQRKGNLNRFLEDTPESYYWMGFILADGHFTKSNQLVVVSAEKDRLHLEKLANFLECTVKTYKRSFGEGSYEGSEKSYCRVAVQDKILGLCIKEKFQINNQKTYNPPNIQELKLSDNFLISLIIGFIDGDGSFCAPNRIRIECHSSWRDNFLYLKQFLLNIYGISPTISDEFRKFCFLTINTETVKKLREFAIHNKLPIMVRKWL